MTGPATGDPDGGTGARTRTVRSRDTVSAILVVLALGLALRLIIAYLVPGSGFAQDRTAFTFWASDLALNGPFGFYDRPFFHDYTPGYLYVLWAVGLAGQALGGIGDLLKVPPILADLSLAYLVWSMALELGIGRRRALVAAAIVVVNPAIWFDSVIWGQVDSFGVVFLLLAMRELWRGRSERAAVLTVLAAIVKPQFGILVPLVAAVTIRRALWPAGAHGDEPDPERRATTTDWEVRTGGWTRIATTGAAGALTAVIVSAPFGLSIVDLITQIGSAAAGYPYLTVNAYNPWALLSLEGNGLAQSGTWIRDVAGTDPGQATAFLFGPFPAVVVGTALLLLAVGAISLAVGRRPDRLTILVGVVLLALAFFVVPTRVHERYLFPFLIAGTLLAAGSPRWRVVYVLVSAATFANMYVVLTTIYPDNPGVSDWLGIGPAIRSPTGVALIAVTHLAAFAWSLTQLRSGARHKLVDEWSAAAAGNSERPRRLTAFARTARGPIPAQAHRLVPTSAADLPASPDVSVRRSVPAMSSSAPAAVPFPGPAPLPTWTEHPSVAEVGLWEWFQSRVSERPVRADRSRGLHAESGGRLDRLDLWLVVVLVVTALTMRVWRLGEPYKMHFDEVYHARTATEFLQDWRYGIDHDIYEWTHPHLAKYAIAGGLVAFGDDRVVGESDLGVAVLAAVVEARRDELLEPSKRAGDRVWVATPSDVRAYDLATRDITASTPIPGVIALVADSARARLFLGTADGRILTFATATVDAGRWAGTASIEPFLELARVGPAVRGLHVTADGATLLAVLDDDTVVSLDAADGTEIGRTVVAGASQTVAGGRPALADAGSGSAVIATPASVGDRSAVAAALASIVGGDAADYAARLATGEGEVVLGPAPSAETRTALDAAITDGRLPGIAVGEIARVAVAGQAGVVFLDGSSGAVVSTIDLVGGAQGLARATGIDDDRLYATNASPTGPSVAVIITSGESAKGGPSLRRSFALPGAGSWIGYDDATQQVHVLGRTQGSNAADGPLTVYVIEPHGDAVYADAPLPFAPVALGLDANGRYPSSDREQLLAFAADGRVAAVAVGQHAFAWRLPGVIAGVVMAALMYLLARVLFRRRSVAVLAAVLVVAEGMLFVQSRIAMNDAYVGMFVLAAYLLFAAIWTGWWRWRGAFWLAMPAIGAMLGLALSAKWVAAYAIAAIGLLILIRSALGRVLVVLALLGGTTVLGYLAISVPEGQGAGNLLFLLIMVSLTLLAAVVSVLRPIAWTRTEHRFAVAVPILGGVAVAALAVATGRLTVPFAEGSMVSPLLLAISLTAASAAIQGAFVCAGRLGFGPAAGPPAPDDPVALLERPVAAPGGWLRLGSGYGLPAAWMALCLLALPIGIYVASYLPWAAMQGHAIVTGWPDGATGQTLLDLTAQMYRYHNTLTAAHAASSPWWAWPFDLKPVWFYQGGFAGGTSAAIYDAGNLITWWLAIPAMVFAAWQAYRRRSLALAMVMIALAFQWLSWSRIDRAAFQYHWYTSLPFVILAFAYFLAELWHGASRRTWLLARLAAAAALLAPAAMWLLHRPLCGFVGVESVAPSSRACPTVIPEFLLTGRTLAIAIVVGVGIVLILRDVLALGDRGLEDGVDPDTSQSGDVRRLVRLVATAAATTVVMVVAMAVVPDTPIVDLRSVPVEPVALLLFIPLGALAVFVATARDAHRFVAGAIVAIAGWFVVAYPNLSALPLPSALVNAYQGIIPTYLYPFQFPVSTVDRNVEGPSLIGIGPAVLLIALTITVVVISYSAWVWRIALAERAVEADGGDASITESSVVGDG
ncbi:MAG: phospholipid carrier-dependent glycosyltransferase [Chloroflexota bacterium]